MMSLRAVLEELRTALRAHISNARDEVADFALHVANTLFLRLFLTETTPIDRLTDFPSSENPRGIPVGVPRDKTKGKGEWGVLL